MGPAIINNSAVFFSVVFACDLCSDFVDVHFIGFSVGGWVLGGTGLGVARKF
jgi:hypothetical protein